MFFGVMPDPEEEWVGPPRGTYWCNACDVSWLASRDAVNIRCWYCGGHEAVTRDADYRKGIHPSR